MIKIVDFSNSKKPDKRYRITLEYPDGKMKSWDFGAKGGSTYIDHADIVKRDNYWRRHCANPVENHRINNNIPSASLFSARLLWGESDDLTDNLVELQRLLNKK
jgi:hypothetical protein